ncbi:MAG: response regulator transcription factor [Eggerthella lenta]
MAQDRAKEGVRLPYVLRHFDVSYLGICAPHVWIYCVAHRAGLDFGGVVIGIPLYIALSAFMLAVMLLAWKGKAQRVAPKLDWPLAALQAAATLLLVVPLPLTGAASATAAAVAAGIGVAWLYLQWAPFYAKLDVREAIACIFCAMAVGSALKVPIDLLPPVPAAVVLMALPFASAALARRAQRKQPPTEREPRMFYDQNPMSIPWTILFGVAAYSLIIGVIQGMPIRRLHPVLDDDVRAPRKPRSRWLCACCGGCSRRAACCAFPACGARSCCSRPRGCSSCRHRLGVGGRQPCHLIAQTLVVITLFWTMLADVAHHSRTSPYVIFGSGWIAYSLPFALGELAGKAEGLHGAGSAVLLALAYLLTIAAVFALNEANFSQRRIFADLEGPAPERSMFASIDEGCERLGSQRGLTAREVEVLQLLCKGRSKSYIAESLFISENTVRSHSKHIYAKLDVHSKQEILDLIAQG